jgi:hypothetical protein
MLSTPAAKSPRADAVKQGAAGLIAPTWSEDSNIAGKSAGPDSVGKR